MTTTLCEKCGKPVEVYETVRYRKQTLYKYTCECGHTKKWESMPNCTLERRPRS